MTKDRTTKRKGYKLSLFEMTLFAMFSAMMFISKIVMEFLPNIHLLGMFTMLLTVVYRKKALVPIYLYVLLEILFYGLNLWSINYLYVWLILAVAAYCMKGVRQRFAWAMLCGLFGLLFGALCAPVYLFSGGLGFAVSWWISGIPFDISHCVGNFVIALVLFAPLRELLEKLYKKMKP